ncbi:MAG TPA: hypothetical protein VLW26_03010 [Steroidobacteraceae bacterium]|nr:hypothetical protein [Steroidobacteraceae bacterium]
MNRPAAFVALALCSVIVLMPAAAVAADAPAPLALHLPGCLPDAAGYLRARLRGALNQDLDWADAQIECSGGSRNEGGGVRLSFAGPPRQNGQRLRLLFGIGGTGEGRAGRALPTNVTLIVEGARRLYSTQGEDKCTVDSLKQERLPGSNPAIRSYRVTARGFCVAPASSLSGKTHVLISRFDFCGRVTFPDADERH